jgi:hypothetical protein
MFKGNSFVRLCILGLAAIARADAAEAPAPANTIVEMFTGLKRCLALVAMAEGTEVTIQFSLNRRGGLIGKPRITYAHWTGDDAARKQSAQAIAEGFDKCLPMRITDQLGGAIAGRPIAFRLRGGAGREENI